MPPSSSVLAVQAAAENASLHNDRVDTVLSALDNKPDEVIFSRCRRCSAFFGRSSVRHAESSADEGGYF